MLEKTSRKPGEREHFQLKKMELTVNSILIFSVQVLVINTLTVFGLDFFTLTASWYEEYFLFCSPKPNRLLLVLVTFSKSHGWEIHISLREKMQIQEVWFEMFAWAED